MDPKISPEVLNENNDCKWWVERIDFDHEKDPTAFVLEV
jgi:hypothetical protein